MDRLLLLALEAAIKLMEWSARNNKPIPAEKIAEIKQHQAAAMQRLRDRLPPRRR